VPRWTLDALIDNREILDFMNPDNDAAAHRLLDRIVIAANRLDQFPRIGRPGPEPGLRQFRVPRTAYKIYYRLRDGEEPEIVRVLHSAWKWPPRPRSTS
jgi:toxin ParE1/3/4